MQQNDNPVYVSVIMGVYNGAATVSRAIDSILNQTLINFEFIICDDCSTDDTLNILKKYSKIDKRIKILHNDHHLSLAATLNKCLHIATGKYIARMDDDDVSHFNRLEKQVNFMESNPEYAVLGTKRINFDKIGYWGNFQFSGEVSKFDLFNKPTFVHPSVMIRKNVLDEVGGYTVSKYTIRGQDFDLWCKIYNQEYRGYILDEVLLDYFDDRSTTKRTKFRYRVNSFVYHHYWRKRLKLPFKYEYYSIRPIMVGLVPSSILAYFKRLFKYK